MKIPRPFELEATPLLRGISLIEASAGTGKTYTIAGLFVRLLLAEGLTVEQILVTTFTEAATAELRDRIRRRLRQAEEAFERGASADPFLHALLEAHRPADALPQLRAALRDFDQATISTIHGFCQRMLREHAFESRLLFDTELITDQRPLLIETVEDFWRRQFYEAPPVMTMLIDAEKWSPAKFVRLLEEATRRPLLRVRPEIAREEFIRRQDELCTLYNDLCRLWSAAEPAIRKCICDGEWARRNHTIGTPAGAELLFEQVAEALSGGAAAADAFKALPKFATSALARACRVGSHPPAHDFFVLCDRYAQLASTMPHALEAFFLAEAKAALSREKATRNVFSFDDLLTRLDTALQDDRTLAAQLAERFPAALIDEFQDTDPVQAAIFERIYTGRDGWLYLIGDPKQAIYGFRGADVFTYLHAAAQADQPYTLLTNRRSETGMVEAVNLLFSRTNDPFVLDHIRFKPAVAAGDRDAEPFRIGGEPVPALEIWAWHNPAPILLAEANRQAPLITAAEIARLLASNATIGDRPLQPSDIAVLVAENRQASPVQSALAELGIASRLVTDESVFATDEAGELHTFLAAVAEPAREPLIRAALATELLGLDAADLDALLRDEAAWESRLARFQEYRDRWISGGFIQMFRHFLQQDDVRPRLLSKLDGERRLTNLLHLGELAHAAALQRRLGVRGLVKWIGDKRADPQAATEEMKLRLERDDDAVAIITMHRCKGLEYPVVFCPFVWGKSRGGMRGRPIIFHDLNVSGQPLTLDLAADSKAPAAEAYELERLAEELRLFYVALTRARHRCLVLWGRFNSCEVSAAARIFHPPPTNTPSTVAALEAHMKALTPEQFAADLAGLVAHSNGTIAVRPLPSVDGPLYRPAEPVSKDWQARRFRGRIDRSWRLSSFTSLTSGQDVEPRDYDAATARPDTEIATGGIAAFPAGKRAGSCLHAIFERADFSDSATLREHVDEQLAAFRFIPGEWSDAVTGCVQRTLDTTLPAGFRLRDVPAAAQLREIEFCFTADRLVASDLRAVADPDHAGRFDFEPRRGLVKGFIDLAFEHQGRWFIVDWKSNLLGAESHAYEAPAVRAAMTRHHYQLQYLIYTVALHRWLRLRRGDYDYERDFGGIYYFFLRGIDPARPGLGLFHDRPSRAALEQLDARLGTMS